MTQSENRKAEQDRYSKSPKGRYAAHRNNAKARGIPWEFTFESWWKIWEPHWPNRGRNIGQLVMARNLDVGPYSPSNVKIVSGRRNIQQTRYQKFWKRILTPLVEVH